MIVNHTHKFIFLKPPKTAGSSVQVALRQFCGPDDTVSYLADHNDNTDGKERKGRGEGSFRRRGEGFRHIQRYIGNFLVKSGHCTLPMIQLGDPEMYEHIMNNYTKISIVRNPWDAAVSRFYHIKAYYDRMNAGEELPTTNTLKARKNLPEPTRFSDYMRDHHDFLLHPKQSFDRYYFVDGKMVMDFVLRYENLESDYKYLCNKILKIRYNPLPRRLTKIRKDRSPYMRHFRGPTRKEMIRTIEKENERTIQHFGYKFGK